MTEENLGISEELREIMQEEVSTVIHAAAQVSLQGGFTKKHDPRPFYEDLMKTIESLK